MTEPSQLAEWRAQGHTDKLARFEAANAANAAAKQRILDLLAAAADGALEVEGVATSDRVQASDEIRRGRRLVEKADFTPHPAAIELIIAEEEA